MLDLLDGRIARMTGTTSEFGGELDSLADVISFGVAPALLVYAWGFSTVPRVGWLAAFLFVVCGALRLARFNVQRQRRCDGRYFVGLPIPAAAAMVAALVNFRPAPIDDRALAIACAVAADRALVPDGEHVPLLVVQDRRPEEPPQLRRRSSASR